MKRTLLALPGTALLLAQLMLAQADVSTPAPVKRPSPRSATKPTADCRPQPTVTSNGLEFTGCAGEIEHVDRRKFDPGSVPRRSASGQPGAVSDADLEPETRAKQQEALRAKFDYQAFSFYHAKRTFDFQYWSGNIIFWVVLLIVFAGLAFSAVQFYVGLRHPLESRAKTDDQEPAPNDAGVSEFEASLQGIKLKSSVLGLLILAMSMVFFYLYLKYVYQISNISQ